MPSRWEVALAGPADTAIPLAAPLAVVSGWLDDPRPSGPATSPQRAARSGHGDQARKWACGPLQMGPPGSADGVDTITSIQVRLLDDSLSDRLTAATQPGLAVRLGSHQYRIAQGARLAGRASWPELRRWSGARAWQVRFVTPACVRRGNRTSPWVAPESLARGLAERWRGLDPATAPPRPGPGTGPVWVSDFEGHSQVQLLTRTVRRGERFVQEDEVISGFTGRVRYVCDRGTDTEAAGFDALMAFAAFAGVGSHTTCGFGVVAAEPTWQPPTMQAGQP